MESAKEEAPVSGDTKTFGQTRLWAIGPPTATAGVLALPDIFGSDSGRIKADAEHLGKLGYAVVVPDAAKGDYKDPEHKGDRPSWLRKYSFDEFAGARIADAIAYLQQEADVKAASSYSFCWSAYLGAAQSASVSPELKGHASFHSSWKAEDMIHGDGTMKRMAERISVPQLLLAAGNDADFLRQGGGAEQILQAKPDIGARCEVRDFANMLHGWVNRGDVEDAATKAAVVQTWHAAVQFFTQTVNPL